MFSTLFLQNNARRFQAVVSCLRNYHIRQRTLLSDIIKLIKALDVSKAHGHDGISVKIIKICADSIAHPLTSISQNSLVAGIFANDWKKANIVPIYKKKRSTNCFKLRTSFSFTDM